MFCTFCKTVFKCFRSPVAIILDTPGGLVCVWLEVPLQNTEMLFFFFLKKTCGRLFAKRSIAIRSMVSDVLSADDGLKHSRLCHHDPCYRPQRSWGKVIFSEACVHILSTGEVYMVGPGGGMCGCSGGAWLLQGVCVWLLGGHAWLLPGGGHVWLLQGGMHGCSGGACVVAPGGACMVALGGHAWLLWGACMVAPRGACVVAPWGACVVSPGGGMCGIRQDTEIRSMSRRYASYWNAFLYSDTFRRKLPVGTPVERDVHVCGILGVLSGDAIIKL